VKNRVQVALLCCAIVMAEFNGRAEALQWQAGVGCRRAKLTVLASPKTGFTLLPSSTTGVVFTNTLSEERIMANANLLNGSGVALGDYDGDGLCDIYLCDLSGRNALFRNLGNWRFTNVTDSAGVACPGQTSTGAVFADLNGDGRSDLLVTSMGGPNACFLNEGGGRFTNVTAAVGLTSRLGSASLALADIDGNGTLDLYVANYGVTSLLRSGGALSYRMVGGKPVVTGSSLTPARQARSAVVWSVRAVLYAPEASTAMAAAPTMNKKVMAIQMAAMPRSSSRREFMTRTWIQLYR
jgi:hypothetical protein